MLQEQVHIVPYLIECESQVHCIYKMDRYQVVRRQVEPALREDRPLITGRGEVERKGGRRERGRYSTCAYNIRVSYLHYEVCLLGGKVEEVK
jgi:hypothetical protein